MEELLIPVLAGLLAGIGTGFAGLSAAVFISPMLITFLGVDSFSAIGIALASDVLASAASAITYYRNGNTALNEVRPLMVLVFLFAILGTAVSHFFTGFSLGENFMGWWLLAALLALGLELLLRPKDKASGMNRLWWLPRKPVMVLGGCYIGFVCGFQGTGGGLMLLFVLNILLKMDFKKAVGSSVCIMSLTALIGAVSHFTLQGFPDLKTLVICVISTLLGAELAAIFANKAEPILLKRLTGGLMVLAGLIMLGAKVL